MEALTKRKTVTVNDMLILPYSNSEVPGRGNRGGGTGLISMTVYILAKHCGMCNISAACGGLALMHCGMCSIGVRAVFQL